MIKIRMPFGFKTMCLDNMFVFYTGKIRIKCDVNVVYNALNHTTVCIGESVKGYTIIRYITKDFSEHCTNMEAINDFIAELMHARIDHKYRGKCSSLVSTGSILEDELPF